MTDWDGAACTAAILIPSPMRQRILSAEAERKLALLADVVSSFINTARGAVIDEDALLSDLNTGRIVAALDVFDEELQPSKSPFRSLSNVVL